MRVGILFSGGKDSNFALYKASQKHEISCLISMISQNSQSYMFQTPGNEFIRKQAEALQIPLIEQPTKGEKELELEDLKIAIKKAKDEFGIEAVVTGAIGSVYQASRVQKICLELGIWCFNPLWQIDEKEFLDDLLKSNFEIMIIAVASYPLTDKYLGRVIDERFAKELVELNEKYLISLIGEGGEFESFVMDGPLFKKKLMVISSGVEMDSENSGFLNISEVRLVEK